MATKEEIIKQNLEFVYGKRTHDVLDDPDKVSYRPTKAKYVDPDAITSFAGEYEFLAPAFPCKVYLPEDPSPYPSFEHALLASKFKNDDKKVEVRSLSQIKDVKRLISKEKGKTSVLFADWTDRCTSVAEMLLLDKFIRNRKLKEQLMKTGRRTLIFKNDFGDLFWGVDEQLKGQNQLGKLLEKVRTVIDQGDDLETWVRHQVKLIEPEKVSLEVVVTKDGVNVPENSKTIELKSKFLIGKSEDLCEIVAAHPTVSRVHAMLVVERTQGCLQIIDLGSANGSKLNGVALAPYEIITVTQESVLTFGASVRQYRFVVDTRADEKRKAALLQKIAQDQSATTYGGASNEETLLNTVFVGNISFDATENDIRAFFAPCGAVVQINVPKDRASGTHKGIAFVTFVDFKGVMQALARDGDELCGRNVKVKKSDAKKPATSGKPAQGERRELRDHRTAAEHDASRNNDDRHPNRTDTKHGLQGNDSEDRRGAARGRSRDRSRDRHAEHEGRPRRSSARDTRDRDDRDLVRDDHRGNDRNRVDRKDHRRREDSRDRQSSRRTDHNRSPPSRRRDSRDRKNDRARDRRSPSRSPPRKQTREQEPPKDRRRGHSPSPPRRVREKTADKQQKNRNADRSPSPPRRQRAASPSPPRRPKAESPSPPRRAREASPVVARDAVRNSSPSPPRRPRALSASVARSASPSPPRRHREPSPSPARRNRSPVRGGSKSPPRKQRRGESPSPPRRPRAPSASASPSPPRRSRFN